MSVDREGLLFENADSPTYMFVEENDNNEECVRAAKMQVSKPKKRIVIKRFRKEWLDEDIFAGWLQPIPTNPERCFCAVCNSVLIAGHSELEKHAASRKHTILFEHHEKRLREEKNIGIDGLMSSMGHQLDEELPKDILDTIEFPTVQYEIGADGNMQRTCNTIMKNEKDDNEEIRNIQKNPRRPANKRHNMTDSIMAPQATTKLNIPERPDAAKLLRVMRSDATDDEYEGETDDEEEILTNSKQTMNEIKAEIAYSEKQIIKNKQIHRTENDLLRGIPVEDSFQQMAEKELEAKLNVIEEERRQQLNIFKLKFFEMEAKVKLAEAEGKRAKELHELKRTLLHLQIEREQYRLKNESTAQNNESIH